MGNRAQPKYQDLLNNVGKSLGIPVHWCLGGIHSKKFRENWERARNEHRRREEESNVATPVTPSDSTSTTQPNEAQTRADNARKKPQGHNHDDEDNDEDSDDDDDDDENDDKDSNGAPPSHRRHRQMDECSQFIRKMLQQHKNSRGNHANPSTTPTSLDYVQSHLLKKNHRASKHLNGRPKLGSLRKASQFLTLRDKAVGKLGFLALASQPKQQQRQPTLKAGGGAVTRSASRSRLWRDEEKEKDTNEERRRGGRNEPGGPTTTATATARMKLKSRYSGRRGGKRIKFNTDDNDNDKNDDDDDNHEDVLAASSTSIPTKVSLTKEHERALEETIAEENAEFIPFIKDQLLLFDDCLVPIDPLYADNNNENNNKGHAARRDQNLYTETLQFLTSLALEHAHHQLYHFAVTSQTVLSSSGSSAVARAFKTLRQNLDAHFVFYQPLQDARAFFKNLTSGEDFKNLKNLFLETVVNVAPESPIDPRLNRPYLNLNFSNSTHERMRIRQHLYQLSSPNILKPFIPPSFLSFPRRRQGYDYDSELEEPNSSSASTTPLVARRHFPRRRAFP